MIAVRITCCLLLAICAFASSARGQESVSAELQFSRQVVYVNEIFEMTVVIESVDITLGKEMGIDGLPAEDRMIRGEFREIQPERRVENNRTIERRAFRTRVRIPAAGELQIAPTMKVKVMSRQQGFIGFVWVERWQDVSMKPSTIKVNPLPEEGRPADFSGATGRFSFDVSVSPVDVAVGELVTLQMTVKGVGYTEGMKPPRLAEGQNLRTYDPELSASAQQDGMKVFDQTVIPQNTNATEIPVINFSYFDVESGAYRTERRGPFKLTFHPQKSVVFQQYKPKHKPGSPPDTGAAGGEAGKSGGESGGWFERAKAGMFSISTQGRQARTIRSESAMFAPAGGASVSFDLPEGTDVIVMESHGSWSKISAGDKRGWVPTASLEIEGSKERIILKTR